METGNEKASNQKSLIGKIFSMETLIFGCGCMSLWYGFTEDKSMNIFWGVVIIVGFFILRKVRRKDWTKHWADMEAERSLIETRRREREKAEPPKE
jgi:hypothetical protein